MTATPPPGQPATPAEALRRLTNAKRSLFAHIIASAHLLDKPFTNAPDQSPWTKISRAMEGMNAALKEVVRATDPGPAAPTTYQLPAQPDGPLWDNIGRRWDRSHEGHWESHALHLDWYELLDFVQWLSPVPPAGAEANRDG